MADQEVSAGPTATDPREQRVVIITGASQGMGAALVEAYRKLNYAVVANSRTITAADDPGVAAVAGDIADPATAESLVATAVERFGRVDSLINNAGVFVAKAVHRVHRGGLRACHRGEPDRLLSHHPTCHRADALPR